MKKLLIAFLTLGLAIGITAAPATAAPCPPPVPEGIPVTFVCATAGSDTFIVPLTPAPLGSSATFSIVRSGYRIDLSALLDPDPSITYSILASNLGTDPLAFSFLFSTAIDPTGFPNQVKGSLSGLFTDGAGDGVTVSPTGSNIAVYSLSANGGSTFTNMGVDVGPAGTGTFYGPHTAGPQFGPEGIWNVLRADLSFVVSGLDTAQLSGSGSINIHTPEPATLLLLGSGLTGLAAWGRRRRKIA